MPRRALLIFLLLPLSLLGQDSIADLKKQLLVETDVAKKTMLFIDVSWEYMLRESDSSLYYAQEAYNFSKQQNYAFGQVISLEMQGLFYESVADEFDKAIEIYLEAIALAEQENVNYLDSLHLAIGVLFQQTDNYDKAGEYYELALEEAKKNGHNAVVKIALINLGVIYNRTGQYQLAEQYLKESLQLPSEDPVADDGAYNNLSQVLMKQNKKEEALNYAIKSVQSPIAKEDMRYAIHYATLAETLIQLNRTEGLDTLVPILEAFKSSIISQNERLPIIKGLADIYQKNGNYEAALISTQELIAVNDSIAIADRNALIYDLETQYQTQQAKQALEKKEQQQLFYLLLAGAGFLIALLLGYFFVKNRRKNALLAKQKQMLEATIDEKNILLKETHHRVKNSFQIVSSLLYLQSENMDDREGQLAIQEAQNRVRSMILIHQKLYNKDRLVGIETQDYFNDLVKDIMETNQNPERPIKTKLDICSKVLDIETITPLGLIVNELITNTLKHAWEEQADNKQLHIALNEANDKMILEVADNGKGMSGKIKDSSFGIKLMKALSKKLNASLDYLTSETGGTKAVLTVLNYR